MEPVEAKRGWSASPSAAASGPVSHAIARVALLHRLRARQLLRQIGLYPGQELMMMHLWDTGAQRQSDLATLFDTDSASMTRSVQRLERAGFVRRRPDPTDRRATLVEPTTASNGLRERVERTWAELEAWTVENLTPEQRDHLLVGLHQVETNMAGQAKHTRSARS
jgi:MarR family transcriptional regulator, organic hydroperoxide resistance regulator